MEEEDPGGIFVDCWGNSTRTQLDKTNCNNEYIFPLIMIIQIKQYSCGTHMVLSQTLSISAGTSSL